MRAFFIVIMVVILSFVIFNKLMTGKSNEKDEKESNDFTNNETNQNDDSKDIEQCISTNINDPNLDNSQLNNNSADIITPNEAGGHRLINFGLIARFM